MCVCLPDIGSQPAAGKIPVADLLAIKAYSLSVAKRLDVADTFKGRIDSILGMIQDLKGDTDYALYVEKENVAENKQKIQLFHRFDTKLAEIVGV